MTFQNVSIEKTKTEWIGELGTDISEDTWEKATHIICMTQSDSNESFLTYSL